MATTRQAGAGMLLPPVFPVYSSLASGQLNQASGPISLSAGAVEILPPGQFQVQPGPYTSLQVKDPITGRFRTITAAGSGPRVVLSDGQSFRLANLTGCAVGAFITNVGSGYTSVPTVTADGTGGSTWLAIVGGAVSGTVTITSGGTGFLYPPILLVDAPPAGGIQATAVCTLSAGVINAVTVVNQGAGYAVAPTITILLDPRDTAGSGAVLTTALTGSGVITAIVCTNHGTPVTAVPTLTISGGGGSSGAATAVMCFTATAFAVSNAGVAYGNAQPFLVLTGGGIVAGSAGAVVNPLLGPGLFTPRQANISGTTTSGSVITATGQVVNDGGLFQSVPNGFVLPSGTAALPTTTAIVTVTVGGVTDTSFIYPV